MTHRSLLNIFYILTHAHKHTHTRTLRLSVSHAPSKCGSFVKLLWTEIGKRQKSKCLSRSSLTLPAFLDPSLSYGLIYKKKKREAVWDLTDVETERITERKNRQWRYSVSIRLRDSVDYYVSLPLSHMVVSSCWGHRCWSLNLAQPTGCTHKFALAYSSPLRRALHRRSFQIDLSSPKQETQS